MDGFLVLVVTVSVGSVLFAQYQCASTSKSFIALHAARCTASLRTRMPQLERHGLEVGDCLPQIQVLLLNDL